jgi:hypothetical protein
MVVLAALAAACASRRGVKPTEPHARASTPVVSPAKARRIAGVWGDTLTFLPTWAPPGVEPWHWRSETCACGTDDNRLIVQFKRERTRLDWEVSDRHEFDRIRAGIVCRAGKFATRVIAARTVFYRADTDTAWVCIPIPAGARWYPATGKPVIAPRGNLIVSVRQDAGRTGRLRRAELQRVVASARRPSLPARTSRSRYEPPGQDEVRRMAVAFRRPLFLPRRLPGGFIYSDWSVATRSFGQQRELTVRFGRDSLFAQILWDVSSGFDACGLWKGKLRPQAVINCRAIYANAGIHGVEVSTCFTPKTVGNAKPLAVGMWYDIRLHNPKMLRLAMRLIGTARLVRNR